MAVERLWKLPSVSGSVSALEPLRKVAEHSAGAPRRSSSSDLEALQDLEDSIQRLGALEIDQPDIPSERRPVQSASKRRVNTE